MTHKRIRAEKLPTAEKDYEDRLAVAEKDYEDFLDRLDQLRMNQSNLLDSHLLAISASSLAFSTIFIDKVVPLAAAANKYLLYLSWTAFLISTLAMVVSFKLAVISTEAARESIGKLYQDCPLRIYDFTKSKWDRYLSLANNTALYLFFVGVALLVLFVTVNLHQV